MTEMEKMMAFHAMQTIKDSPDYMQNMNLVLMCSADKTGQTERLARILAEHKMPTDKIAPCILSILQDLLINLGSKDTDHVTGQSD